MRGLTLVSIVLIALGAMALFFQEIPYKTDEGTLQIGPVKAEVTTQKKVDLPKWLGIIAIAGGVVLLIVDRREVV